MNMELTAASKYSLPYMKAINALLWSPANMAASVAQVRGQMSNAAFKAIQWGEYQPILMAPNKWPSGTGGGKTWATDVFVARNSLAGQGNYQALCRSDPSNVPGTKADLLDAAVNRCFANSIPIHTEVQMRTKGDPDRDKHDVRLIWLYDGDMKTEIGLAYVITCPYGS